MSRAIRRLPLLVLLTVQTASAQGERAWQWSSGIGFQIRGNAGEIGRQPNATGGHEDLIARLDGGLALSAHFGLESRFGGGELLVGWAGSAIEVTNVDGVRFPDHGEPPLVWSGTIMVYPLALVVRPGRFQPLFVAGLGGMLISVDLDNIRGQTVYHRFQRSVGGGIRIVNPSSSPMMTTTHVEFRIEQLTTWGKSPLHRFSFLAVTVGLGMSF